MKKKTNILEFRKSKKQAMVFDRERQDTLFPNIDLLIRENKFIQAKNVLNKMLDDKAYQAYYYLGRIHSCDVPLNPIKDYELARECYTKAIIDANSSEACIALATMQREGKGGEIDYAGSRQILEELVSQGIHYRGFVYWLIGRFYVLGQGVEKDLEMASLYFSRGMEHGHIPSLGWMGVVKQMQGKIVLGLGLRAKAGLLGIIMLLVDKNSDRLQMN